jgi:hypothetical protein
VGDRDFRAGEREVDRALALPGDLDRRGESGLDGIPNKSSLHQYTLIGSLKTRSITSKYCRETHDTSGLLNSIRKMLFYTFTQL